MTIDIESEHDNNSNNDNVSGTSTNNNTSCGTNRINPNEKNANINTDTSNRNKHGHEERKFLVFILLQPLRTNKKVWFNVHILGESHFDSLSRLRGQKSDLNLNLNLDFWYRGFTSYDLRNNIKRTAMSSRYIQKTIARQRTDFMRLPLP